MLYGLIYGAFYIATFVCFVKFEEKMNQLWVGYWKNLLHSPPTLTCQSVMLDFVGEMLSPLHHVI